MPSESTVITELGVRWRLAYLVAEKAEAADPDSASWYPVGVAQEAFLAGIRTQLADPQPEIPPPGTSSDEVASDQEIYRLSLLWGQAHGQMDGPTSTEAEFSEHLQTLETSWQALADALDTRPEIQGRSL